MESPLCALPRLLTLLWSRKGMMRVPMCEVVITGSLGLARHGYRPSHPTLINQILYAPMRWCSASRRIAELSTEKRNEHVPPHLFTQRLRSFLRSSGRERPSCLAPFWYRSPRVMRAVVPSACSLVMSRSKGSMVGTHVTYWTHHCTDVTAFCPYFLDSLN